ncbi:MAG TPA: UDP-galactose-lipid carrier transferase [Chthoniobacterales bacterium]|nr:UDP-galactose-lipid carrier transferase [Chthoniobacterales bacterium]
MPKKIINLDALDQNCSITKDVFLRELKKYQLALLNLQLQLKESNRSVIIVMEGPDAAGKGGAIKRVVERLDPRLVRVYSVVKPTIEEYEHHYLWRFWNKLPPKGNLTIFDRSWYGRVLVERVEGFATEKEWQRAYQEINDFERTLIDGGTILIKTFMMITKDEQLRRFKERQKEPFKHWKINEEDWRNRRKWKQHNEAASVMFEKTSSKIAPWTVIPANYKWYARVKFAQTVYETVAKEFKTLP